MPDHLDANLFSALFDAWVTTRLLGRTLDDALETTSLPGDDFAMYHLVAMAGPIAPSEIANFTGMRRSTVSTYLRRMDGRRHTRHTKNPTDGRSYSVQLNAAGRRAYERAIPSFVPVLAAIENQLKAGGSELRQQLQDLDDALRNVANLPPRPYRLGDR